MVRRIFWMTVLGAAVGSGLASFFAPRVLSWYLEPPVQLGVSCKEAVEWALRRLLWFQAAGSSIGAVLGSMAGIALRPGKKTAGPSTQPPSVDHE